MPFRRKTLPAGLKERCFFVPKIRAIEGEREEKNKMAYSLEQIYEALGKVENGGAMVADLQEAISKTRNEAATSRLDRNKVLDALGLRNTENNAGGLDASLANLTATLTALKQYGEPESLGKQLGELQNQVKELAAKYEASEKKAKEEHDKRVSQSIETQLIAALTEGKAVSPKDLSKLLRDSVAVKDDGGIVYKDGDKESSLADGVKNWLAANKWAVKNETTRGAGSGTNSEGGGKKYTMADLQGMTREQINANWAEISKGVEQ